MYNLRFRQVHLDFHTSELIPGVGSEFCPDQFADTLKAAHVNSITCFSRCHHGMIYHDTAKFPERRHPSLTCNLLKEQIEACHARDIRVPIYITVQWDMYTCRRHPEWLQQSAEGTFPGTKPFDAGFYRRFCLNTPYVDFLAEQTAEVCETMPVDGIFFDIVSATPCCCPWCMEGMMSEGLDPSDPKVRSAYADRVLFAFEERFFSLVKGHDPEASVFFNAGHVGPKHRKMISSFTHLELESLPSGGWGYLHFPLSQRFARNLGLDCMGMTGKFHTSWGDFSSFKNPVALEFECLNMLALGGKCSIGDQLHPTGKIDADTYDLIGGAYAKVEAAEPWCEGARPVVEIGVLTPEEFVGDGGHGALPAAAMGATRMLQELRQQFDMVDSQSDFSAYKVLILPDEVPVDETLAAKLSAFVAAGGALLASYRSGLTPCGCSFALPQMGVSLRGEAEFSPDFIVPGELSDGLRDTGYVMYLKGMAVTPAEGAQVLSPVIRPYFNRTWEHFCSHKHTPAQGPADYPGVVQSGNCIYFMHPVFTQYDRNAPLWCKKLVGNALRRLLPQPVVQAGGPSAALFTLNSQPQHSRLVLHVLHYVPERRGRDFDVIEDIVPIFGVPVTVKVVGMATSVRLAPQGTPLVFEQVGSFVNFVIPRIDGAQMVEVNLQD